jgi:hypothetical protein
MESHEDTLVMNPSLSDDDNVKTREYVRPKFPSPVEWSYAAPPQSSSHQRTGRKYTRTITVPALRHLVGMPVMPAFAPRAPAPAETPRPALRAPKRSKRAPSRLRAGLALAAFSSSVVAAAVFTIEAISTAEEGSIVVSAYGVSGVPTGFKVIADGETRCTEAPCRFAAPAGEHYVTVVAPGYERASTRRIRVAEDTESNLHFELVPQLK